MILGLHSLLDVWVMVLVEVTVAETDLIALRIHKCPERKGKFWASLESNFHAASQKHSSRVSGQLIVGNIPGSPKYLNLGLGELHKFSEQLYKWKKLKEKVILHSNQ